MWTAIWLFISGLILALIAPMVGHAIKLAEFRQTWINDLRKDVADYIGLCRRWVRGLEEYFQLERSGQGEKLLKKKNEELSSTANDALVILWRIKMRINPRDNEFKRQDDLFLELLDGLLDDEKIRPAEPELERRWRVFADSAVSQSRELLKREWEVTKQFWPRWILNAFSETRDRALSFYQNR